MKVPFTQSLKLLLRERRIMVALALFIILTIAFIIYVSLNIHQNELKLVTHYSAFGATNFYRDKWYYLLTFIVFGLALTTLHTFIAIKLLLIKGSELALGFVWISIVILCVAAAVTHQVLTIAALT